MDDDLKSIIRSFISKSHPIVKNFIASGDLEETVEEIARDYNLNEEEISGLNDLLASILIGLGDPDEFFSKVAEIISLPPALSEDLAVALQNIILSTLASKIEPLENKNQNNIGQSFEQIILNQARAMMPAREASEATSNEIRGTSYEKKPDNLPTGNSLQTQKSQEPKAIHNYLPGQDPYREPLE